MYRKKCSVLRGGGGENASFWLFCYLSKLPYVQQPIIFVNISEVKNLKAGTNKSYLLLIHNLGANTHTHILICVCVWNQRIVEQDKRTLNLQDPSNKLYHPLFNKRAWVIKILWVKPMREAKAQEGFSSSHKEQMGKSPVRSEALLAKAHACR